MNIEELNNPFVPYSNRKYQVNQFGEIIDLTTNIKLELIEKDNDVYVELDWVDGKQLYKAATVVIVSFRPHMFLPPEHFKDIIPLYRNNNYKDLTPTNLTYKLPTDGIEVRHPLFKGFYYIPEYTSYGISKDSVIIDIRRNNIKNLRQEFKSKDNRPGVVLTNDFRSHTSRAVYRLAAITFIQHDGNYEKLQVNHINGNPHDGGIENLEWATPKENINHAFDTGLTNNNTVVECKNYLTNEIKTYRSIKYACDDLNLDYRYFQKGLEVGFIKIYENPKDWYYIRDKSEDWKEISIENIPVRRNTEGTTIKALNVFTNNIILFSSIGNAVKELKVDLAGIIYHMRRDSLVPYHGYMFRYMTDDRPFPKFTEDQLYLFKTNIDNNEYPKVQQGYASVDLQTNEKKIWTKTKDLADFLKMHSDTITRKFKDPKNTYVFNDRYQVSLIRPEGVMS